MKNSQVLKKLNKVGETYTNKYMSAMPNNYSNGYMQAVRDCKFPFLGNDEPEITADIEKIAHYYGYENQSMQLIEELAELIQATNHLRRCTDYSDLEHRQALFEEMADVKIMIAQMEILMNCHDEVDAFMKYKIDRQLKRIKENQA